tara:strand:- start:1597 stop:2178 length:582 start_codon:yes stop_codon:yes gene_type:complete
MANVDSAFGLKPYEGLSPSGAIPQARKYLINPSGYGTTIYQGDLVKFNGGYIEQAGVSDANIVGVFNGVHYQSSDGPVWSNFYTASTTASSGDIEVYIYDDPNTLFTIQGDSDTASTQAAVGKNADTVGTGGSTTTGLSSRELDVSTLATTAGLQLKVVGVVDNENNGTIAGTHANLIVQINEHAYKGPVAGT